MKKKNDIKMPPALYMREVWNGVVVLNARLRAGGMYVLVI